MAPLVPVMLSIHFPAFPFSLLSAYMAECQCSKVGWSDYDGKSGRRFINYWVYFSRNRSQKKVALQADSQHLTAKKVSLHSEERQLSNILENLGGHLNAFLTMILDRILSQKTQGSEDNVVIHQNCNWLSLDTFPEKVIYIKLKKKHDCSPELFYFTGGILEPFT